MKKSGLMAMTAMVALFAGSVYAADDIKISPDSNSNVGRDSNATMDRNSNGVLDRDSSVTSNSPGVGHDSGMMKRSNSPNMNPVRSAMDDHDSGTLNRDQSGTISGTEMDRNVTGTDASGSVDSNITTGRVIPESGTLNRDGASTADRVTGGLIDTTPTLSDNDYVTLSGTVGKILNADEFELNYGSGVVKVDTNDAWPEIFTTVDPANNTGYRVKTGDHVTVAGRVDKNWITANEVEAESVRFGSAPDYKIYGDNFGSTGYNTQYFTQGGRISLTGTVAEVDGNEFILQYPGGTIQVDTDNVDGVDAANAKPLAVGERVTVYGVYDKGVFERNEIQAQAIGRSGSPARANPQLN